MILLIPDFKTNYLFSQRFSALFEEKYDIARKSGSEQICSVVVQIADESLRSANASDAIRDNRGWFDAVWGEFVRLGKTGRQISDWSHSFLDTFQKQLEDTLTEASPSSHLTPLLQALSGYVYQSLGNDEEALRQYSASKLVEQRFPNISKFSINIGKYLFS